MERDVKEDFWLLHAKEGLKNHKVSGAADRQEFSHTLDETQYDCMQQCHLIHKILTTPGFGQSEARPSRREFCLTAALRVAGSRPVSQHEG